MRNGEGRWGEGSKGPSGGVMRVRPLGVDGFSRSVSWMMPSSKGMARARA